MTETALNATDAAKSLGVTPKALRLYEMRGLVAPMRTEAGWRIYGPAQISRLHQILALKGLGLSLSSIASLMAGNADTLDSVLSLQERALNQQMRRSAHALTLVRAARQKLAKGSVLSIADLATLTQETTAMTPLWEKYFTQAELDEIAKRDDLNQEEFVATWRALWAEVEMLSDKGDHNSPQSLDLGRRWLAQSELFTRGDRAFSNKLRALTAEAMADPETMARLPFTREAYNFIVEIVKQVMQQTRN
jgi:DNA-binding transcriptional MerR regulator